MLGPVRGSVIPLKCRSRTISQKAVWCFLQRRFCIVSECPGVDRLCQHKRFSVPMAFGFQPTRKQWLAIRSGLDTIQLRVVPFSGHEFFVCAHLHQACAIQHDDQVGHAHRREAV